MESEPAGDGEPDERGADRLRDLGWNDRWEALHGGIECGAPGRVVRHDGTSVVVATAAGVVTGRPARTSSPIVTGDWVTLRDDGRVTATLERATLLSRRDPGTGGVQPIAANVDLVIAVCSLDRPISSGFIERLVAVAWDSGALPLIVLTKCDLVDDFSTALADVQRASPFVDVIATSAVTGDRIDEVQRRCRHLTAVIIGHSGAGKSTLVNALAGSEVAATGTVRGGDRKGRHTTTARHLHILEGFCLIDTPGVRELGMSTSVDTIDDLFADITDLAARCRFVDCAHGSEPGCAVHEAIATDSLDERRLASWNALRREAAAATLRADPVASRHVGRRQARVYREAQSKRRGRR